MNSMDTMIDVLQAINLNQTVEFFDGDYWIESKALCPDFASIKYRVA
jgi:hypothetical protein